MLAYPPERVRTVALVGHSGSGKTTLAEALLHATGATTRIGRVEDGTTVCDSDPEEVKRRISLSLHVAPIEVACDGGPMKVNLLDTPGDPDLAHEVAAALAVADLAIVVVSAVDGVQVGTINAWRQAAAAGVPRLVFVNKLDRDRADFERVLEELRARLGEGIAPLELPVGQEASFHGVADVLTDRAYVYDDGTEQAVEAELPSELVAHEHEAHDALVEGIVVGDDTLLERYLEGEEPSFDELEHLLAGGLASATVFPVLVGSALRGMGVDRLVRYLCEIAPSPAVDASGPPVAFVFKTVADPFVGRISVFKVLSGTIRDDAHLVNPRTGTEERLHRVFALRGKDHVEVHEIQAGDVGAVAKLDGTLTGDTLAPKGTPVVVPPVPRPEPGHAVALVARTQADEDKLGLALHRLQEEDPALRISRNEETHQTLVEGTGEIHLAVAVERLQRKFGVAVDTEEVKVPFRETISVPARAEGRHKKQSGGHGQFGVAVVEIEPLPRGAGFEFVDAVVGGAVPRQFIPAVEKGVLEAMAAGGTSGHPVVDVRVRLVDGKAHPVDSSEMSFKMAGALAFREALAMAEPILLEPVSALEVTVPDELQGEVLGDLHTRRARILGSEASEDGEQVLRALVPTAELRHYGAELRSLTGGRGHHRATHAGYDPAPRLGATAG
jgi:elongation factor G